MKHKSHQPLKGLNLGGWLVVEKWMTPSLFEGLAATNEYELSQTEAGRRRIAEHRKTFIQAEDLDWLVLNSIEIVRVPVGHWAVHDAPPYIFAQAELDWLMNETRKRGIKVLLDLHAAPGAQNSYEHSGSGNREGREAWLKNKSAQSDTIKTLEYMSERYGDFSNLWGMQLLNEPAAGLTGWRLVGFYRRAYKRISKHLTKRVYVLFSDAYAPFRLAGALNSLFGRTNPVATDSHFYQCFSVKDKARGFESHLKLTKRRRWLIILLSKFQPVVVGEWSAVLPQKLTPKETKVYYEAQSLSHEAALAVFYWNYKTDGTSPWNYCWLIDNNILY